jgi:hypothetical protein
MKRLTTSPTIDDEIGGPWQEKARKLFHLEMSMPKDERLLTAISYSQITVRGLGNPVSVAAVR